MVMIKITRKIFLLFVLIINSAAFAQNQVRVMSYNLENYNSPYTRDTDYAKVINQIKPDIIVVVEMLSQQGVNQFLNNALTSEYRSAPVNIHNDGSMPYNDCGFYFKYSVLTLIQTTEISADTRVISEFKLVHNATKDTLIVFGVHLKAYEKDSTRRASAVTSLRNRTAQLNNKTNYLVCGDFNIFKSSESAFVKLLDQSAQGYFIDPINAIGNWNKNLQFASVSTWSTRGGVNTRLDMILISQSLNDVGGVDYIADSFKIFGNDGMHFYTDVNSGYNTWFANDAALGNSVRNASDHLPVYADFSFGVPTAIKENEAVPLQFELSQNYPNPFNPSTTIRFSLLYRSQVTLKIFDVLGREVATLVNEEKSPGNYEAKFSAKGEYASGVYFYRLQVVPSASSEQMFSETKKMILLR